MNACPTGLVDSHVYFVFLFIYLYIICLVCYVLLLRFRDGLSIIGYGWLYKAYPSQWICGRKQPAGLCVLYCILMSRCHFLSIQSRCRLLALDYVEFSMLMFYVIICLDVELLMLMSLSLSISPIIFPEYV